MPYVQGTTDKISKILRRHQIKTIFKPHRKLHSFMRPIKSQIPLHSSGVYKIPCSCESVYVGQTGRLVSTRLKEHMRHTKNQHTEKSALADHSVNTKHLINFEETSVIKKCDRYYRRLIHEAIEINKHKDSIIQEQIVCPLKEAWVPLLRKFTIANNYQH